MVSESDRLQVERNKTLHEREWKVQRVGWFLGVALIAAALAGLLGSGPLSDAKATAASGSVTIHYDRFVHSNSEQLVRVQLDSLQSAGDPIALKLPLSFLQRARLLRIHPEPIRSKLAADGTMFEFDRLEGAGQATIDFHLEFRQAGAARGSVALEGREAALFTQFVYP